MTLKLCKDCKHYRSPDYLGMDPTQYSRCTHPDATKTEPVTGQKEPGWCDIERGPSRGCGNDGKRWEPRETFGEAMRRWFGLAA